MEQHWGTKQWEVLVALIGIFRSEAKAQLKLNNGLVVRSSVWRCWQWLSIIQVVCPTQYYQGLSIVKHLKIFPLCLMLSRHSIVCHYHFQSLFQQQFSAHHKLELHSPATFTWIKSSWRIKDYRRGKVVQIHDKHKVASTCNFYLLWIQNTLKTNW